VVVVSCDASGFCAFLAHLVSEKVHVGSLESRNDNHIQLHSQVADPFVLQAAGPLAHSVK